MNDKLYNPFTEIRDLAHQVYRFTARHEDADEEQLEHLRSIVSLLKRDLKRLLKQKQGRR